MEGRNFIRLSLDVDENTLTLLKYDFINLDWPIQEELCVSIQKEGNLLYDSCKKEKAMIIDVIEYQLKDGRAALIRSPKEKDVQEMLDFLYVSAGETDFLMRCPEECGRYTPESEKQRFDRGNKADNETMLLCFVEGKLAGSGQTMWSKRVKIRHRASIAVTVLRQFWSQGIAVKLIQELIKIAEKNPDILQIELEFVEGNTRARALYEKMGFRITGVKPDAIRLKDGALLNEYSMMRKIKRQPSALSKT